MVGLAVALGVWLGVEVAVGVRLGVQVAVAVGQAVTVGDGVGWARALHALKSMTTINKQKPYRPVIRQPRGPILAADRRLTARHCKFW